MSCNGCRVLRKGCSERCVLRHCLRCIESPEAQAHATLFVTKFFGRAGLTGFINSVSENQRPALFQSLLYEACGRTVNPVYGAVGLLFSGKWAVCQAAVETVLRGGSPCKPAALNVVSTKPNLAISSSSLKDHPAGSVSTLDPSPAAVKTTASTAVIGDTQHVLHPGLPALESTSLANSASSFKASSFHVAEKHCVLDFSTYSVTSSSADKMINRSQHFKKRPRDSEPKTTVDDDLMLQTLSTSGFPNGSSAAITASDPCDAAHFSSRPLSNMAWIERQNKANCRRIDSNDYLSSHGVYAPAGRDDHVVLGSEIKHAANKDSGLVNAPSGPAMRGTHHDLVAPVARRIYIPQPMKQGAYPHGGAHTASKSKQSSNYESAAAGDFYQANPRMQSGTVEEGAYSSHQGAVLEHAFRVDATDIQLNLSLQAQHGELCYDHGELVNHETEGLIIMKHEEPQVLLRMPSPSVNSEGSVNTLVGGLDRSSCTASFDTPQNGVKLLNLLF